MILMPIIGFIIWSKDPLNDVVNFVIGGTIPSTKHSIGFWSMILLSSVILFILNTILKGLKLQMLAHTAAQIKAEEAKKDFETSHNFEFDPSKRSVIAARN